jgi:hypothetical protein
MVLRRNRLPPKTTSQILRFVEEQKKPLPRAQALTHGRTAARTIDLPGRPLFLIRSPFPLPAATCQTYRSQASHPRQTRQLTARKCI